MCSMRPAVRDLVLQRPVVALEHRDEQREREERVRAHLEQRDVVVLGAEPSRSSSVNASQVDPRRCAVEDPVGHLGLPPGDGARRVLAVALDQRRVAVDGEEELVQQVLAHASAPSGYQVK